MADTTSGILTDVGTNELEVVEFYVDGRSYAINVAKVREIVRPRAAMAVPESHPCVLGVFRNRDDAEKYLPESQDAEICEIKNLQQAQTFFSAIAEMLDAVALDPIMEDGVVRTQHCFLIDTLLDKYLIETDETEPSREADAAAGETDSPLAAPE